MAPWDKVSGLVEDVIHQFMADQDCAFMPEDLWLSPSDFYDLLVGVRRGLIEHLSENADGNLVRFDGEWETIIMSNPHVRKGKTGI